MLPAHSYPKLKGFRHLAGHYGTAWHNQREEFRDFNGAILFTTNCIQKPDRSYADNVFTTGPVGYPGLVHVTDRKRGAQKDFSVVINKAIELGGVKEKDGIYLTTGFGHNSIMSAADKNSL